MNIILKEKLGNGVQIYIDDILIYGRTKDEHDENLKYVLNILDKYGLEENKNKRIECASKVNFLGYEIGYNIVRPLLNRSQGITDYSEPRSKREIQRFIGLLNYDRIS